MSALFRWPCSISIHLSPRSVTASVRLFPLAMQHFYSFVSQVCHCWCPPFSVGHVAFLFICLPGLSLLVSALVRWSVIVGVCPFRWRCNISIPRSVTAGVRPFRWPCSISTHLFPGSVTGAAALFRWPCTFLFLLFVFQGACTAVSALSAGIGSPVKGSCSFERGA